MFHQNLSLKSFNTFGLEVNAHSIITASNLATIILAWKNSQNLNLPFIVLGQGSNVFFLENFNGIVVINAIKGIIFKEYETVWNIHVGAGENWNSLVEVTLNKGINGLENLAFIPGMVGAAPIQNIGAYGVEFNNICQYVEALHLPSEKIIHLPREACEFGYRDSIFKHSMKDEYVIIAVGLRLTKQWKPILHYNDLSDINPHCVSAKDIFNIIHYIRKNKLPDPQKIGNVGSFFKNPIIPVEMASMLLYKWPNMPYYMQNNGSIKLVAAWLIDQCDLKGYRIGGAAIYYRQAVVLINENNATSNDIILLAKYVRKKVSKKFHIWLEPEVRFISAKGECNAIEVIS